MSGYLVSVGDKLEWVFGLAAVGLLAVGCVGLFLATADRSCNALGSERWARAVEAQAPCLYTIAGGMLAALVWALLP